MSLPHLILPLPRVNGCLETPWCWVHVLTLYWFHHQDDSPTFSSLFRSKCSGESNTWRIWCFFLLILYFKDLWVCRNLKKKFDSLNWAAKLYFSLFFLIIREHSKVIFFKAQCFSIWMYFKCTVLQKVENWTSFVQSRPQWRWSEGSNWTWNLGKAWSH